MEQLNDVLSLMALSPEGKILLGQRALSRARHPGVLSTITMRIEAGAYFIINAGDHAAAKHYVGKMIDERLTASVPVGYIAGVDSFVKLVEDPIGTGEAEWTRMTTVQVQLTESWHPDPNPDFYMNMGWFGVEDFKRAYAEKEPQILLPDANPWTLCMHGACVEGAWRMLNG